ncbi:MAG: hypothetical protein QG670_2445 [Thermoproteota archaeon]|nr:hypothetical protein [Thermoproteota archaeon]
MTIETKLDNLRKLRKHVNIWDIDAVKRFIANSSWDNNYKILMEYTFWD